ncbi:DUF2231 domain-containing protein [Rubrolithibacter danxiaensis]|uniref:DUF2231 domain-containing protein n=1 Tax=Rubrolithibacter danxiaensis TaxID=3390805 RepID=UPI003BF7B18E
MKSNASIKSHPIHPILVGFPIAFFIGTLIFDLLGFFNDNNHFLETGKYLEIAGIIAALITAIPGIIDYCYTVPPKSSAKNRATKHGLTNITVVLVFSIALYFRSNNYDVLWFIATEFIGTILLLFAGWMGGTLVYRNQIGVDPRYADAGKWKELNIEKTAGPIEVATSDELKVNQMKLLRIENKRIALARTESGYVAFDDRCTHKGGSLAGGAMICGTVQCPWHGSHFDVRSGAVKAGPAKEAISVYQVKELDNKVFLYL